MQNQSIYKYLERKFAEMMMAEGTVRIGTLYDYRKGEENDSQRPDRNEGKMTYVLDVGEEKNVSELPSVFSERIEGNVNFKNITLRAPLDATDCYVYCCSNIFDETLMSNFKADCCVEIFDIDSFAFAIGKNIAVQGLIYNCVLQGPCNYIGHDVDKDFLETSEFLKDKELFGHQSEYRLIYKPLVKDESGQIINGEIRNITDSIAEFNVPVKPELFPVIEPIIISCPEIISYCRIIYGSKESIRQ